MKKTVSIALLALAAVFVFTACSAPTPFGATWAGSETCVYEVKDGDEVIGEMLVSITKSEEVQNESTVEIELTDGADTLMKSTSKLDLVTPKSTEKTVNYGDRHYTLSASYDAKYYRYTLNNGGVESTGRIRMKTTVIDNELLYTYLRGWEMEAAGFSKTVRIADPFTGRAEDLTAATTTAVGTYVFGFMGKTVEVKCAMLSINRKNSPIGQGITVWYAKKESFNKAGSYHLPVKIVENNMTYNLKFASVTD